MVMSGIGHSNGAFLLQNLLSMSENSLICYTDRLKQMIMFT